MESEVTIRETSASSTSYSPNVEEQDVSTKEYITVFEIDPSQAWFWSAEWQNKEREVDENLAAGRFRDFDNVEDAIRYLHSDAP